MKKPSERGQGVKPPYKRGTQLKMLIVRAGIASSGREAQEMLAADEICILHADDGASWQHGTGKPKNEPPSSLGTLLLEENTQVVHRSKCPECRNKPIVFAKRDRKPAISSTTHALVEEGGARESPSSDSTLIRQEDLEAWIYRRRQFTEIDQPIAVALSKGAAVEYGVHIAELLPVRNEDGSVHLKLMVR